MLYWRKAGPLAEHGLHILCNYEVNDIAVLDFVLFAVTVQMP